MHRLRVIDRRRNALRLERCGEGVAVGPLGQTDGVLRPHRGAAGRKPLNLHDIGKPVRIVLGYPVASRDLVLEDFQLLDKDRRLHGVEPPGEPEPDIVVFVGSLAMHADAAQVFHKLRIVGQDRAAVAETAERFRREKTRRGRKPKGPEPAALVTCAKALRGVVEHEQARFLRNRADRIVVGALPEQIDRDDRFRLEAEPFCGGNTADERGRIHVEGLCVDIDKDRGGAGERRRLAGCAKGERWTDDGIPRPDALCHQHHQERVGAACAAHHMLCAAEGDERGLELGHLGTTDELAMREHAGHRLVDFLAQSLTLGANVDEGDLLRTQMLVHGALRRLNDGHRLDQPTTRRGPLRRGGAAAAIAAVLAEVSRHRVAISRLATPSSPVTAGAEPERTA